MSLSAAPRCAAQLGRPNSLRCTTLGAQRSRLASPPRATASDFSTEQLAFAMQHQLSRSAEAQAAQARRARTPSPATSAIPPRKESRRAVRARAAAEAAASAAEARERSEALQRELSLRDSRSGSFDEARLEFALRTQLRQSGMFDEGEFKSSASTASHSASSAPAPHLSDNIVPSSGAFASLAAASGGSKLAAAPAAAFQDGTLLFTADRLEALGVEDLLTA